MTSFRCRSWLLLLPAALAPCVAQAAAPPGEPKLPDAQRQLVELTNRLRAGAGLGATKPDAQLAATAQAFADFMARNERLDHQADGRRAVDRARAQGYADCMVSENIALQHNKTGFSTRQLAENFFEGWRKSPGHNRNMLEPNATDTAVAIARSQRSGRYYAVQMFGRPAQLKVRFMVTNRWTEPLRYQLDGQDFELTPRMTRTHELCTEPDLRLQLPGEAQARQLKPANGERWTIQRAAGRFSVDRQ